MQELEKILEEINEEIKSSIAFSSVFTDGLCRARNIIINHLSRESTQEITSSSRDNWFPVDERLPEVFGKYWVTIRYDDGRISEPVVGNFQGVKQKYVVDTPNGREYETWGIDSAFHGSRVIAWRPYYIPESYRPERSMN